MLAPKLFAPFCLAIALLSGCTHTQLRITSVNQALTISDIQYQQVLDNLARYVNNPSEMPSLALPTAASNAVNDSANAGVTPTFLAGAFTPWPTALGGSRVFQQNWTLTPVTSADRLRRVRCAYQVVVGAYTPLPDGAPTVDGASCPLEMFPGESLVPTDVTPCCELSDCSKCKDEFVSMGVLPSLRANLEKAFANSDVGNAVEISGDSQKEITINQAALKLMKITTMIDASDPQKVEDIRNTACKTYKAYRTSFDEQRSCNLPQLWYGVSHRRRDVPKDACYVGCDCGTYVWVCADGVDSLARFTMTVIKLGSNDPPAPPAPAQVAYAYDTNGDLKGAVVIAPGIRKKLPATYDQLQSLPADIQLHESSSGVSTDGTPKEMSALRSFIQLNSGR